MDGKHYCEICKQRQEATPEALRAWDDLVHYDCLCNKCYWGLI